MSKHTPGPWIRAVGRGCPWDIEDAKGKAIAQAQAMIADQKYRLLAGPERSQPHRTANAKLVAAAPELYAALEFIIDALEMRAREHDCKGIHCSTCNPMELVEAGRDAIALADDREMKT